MEELPSYLSCLLRPSVQWLCQTGGPKFTGIGYFGK